MQKYKAASEQLKQGGYDCLIKNGCNYVSIGATTVGQLQQAGIIPKQNYGDLIRNKPDGLILFEKN